MKSEQKFKKPAPKVSDISSKASENRIVILKGDKTGRIDHQVYMNNMFLNISTILGTIGTAIGIGIGFFSNQSQKIKNSAIIGAAASGIFTGISTFLSLRNSSVKGRSEAGHTVREIIVVCDEKDYLKEIKKLNKDHAEVVNPYDSKEIADALDTQGIQWRNRIANTASGRVLE